MLETATLSRVDHRDIALEDLAAENADLRSDIVIYREIAQLAIDQSASLTTTVDRQKQRINALIDELRRYTSRQVAE